MPAIPTAQGGTGNTTYTDGQLLIGDSSTNALDKGTLQTTGGATITNGHGSITINAAGPNVGTYASAIVLWGAAVNVMTATDTQIVTLALAAGDWDIWGEVWFDTGTGPATGVNIVQGGINTSSALPTVPADGTSLTNAPFTLTATGPGIRSPVLSLAPCRQAGPGTAFLMCRAGFTGGTLTAYGIIRARRWA